VPPQQQAEWLQMISTRTGQPISNVSTDDPRGFSLGLIRALVGATGAHWFYEGTTLGYRTLYVWFAEDDILITVQTNSQPKDGEGKLGEAVTAIYGIVRDAATTK
jgi:D-alanyl-D-alanine carboxypeptidase